MIKSYIVSIADIWYNAPQGYISSN